jgi:hypothetical protein
VITTDDMVGDGCWEEEVKEARSDREIIYGSVPVEKPNLSCLRGDSRLQKENHGEARRIPSYP